MLRNSTSLLLLPNTEMANSCSPGGDAPMMVFPRATSGEEEGAKNRATTSAIPRKTAAAAIPAAAQLAGSVMLRVRVSSGHDRCSEPWACSDGGSEISHNDGVVGGLRSLPTVRW